MMIIKIDAIQSCCGQICKYLIILAILLITSALPAVENLASILQIAEESDPTYKQAKINALAIAEKVPQARAQIFFPRIAIRASSNRVRDDISTTSFGANGITKYNSRNYGINLTQPIYHHDRLISLSQADKRVQKAQLEVIIAHQNLIYRVAETYFLILAAQDNLLFTKAQTKSLRDQLKQTEQRFNVGLVPVTDLEEARAGYDRASAELIQANHLIDDTQEKLWEITERYHFALEPLAEELPLVTPDPSDIKVWAATAVENSLVLKSANLSSAIAKQEIRRQSSKSLPTLDVIGSHGYGRQGGRFGASKIHKSNIGIEFNMPIFEGGQTLSLTKEASHKHNASIEQLESTRRAVQRETRQAYLGIMSQISTVLALEQAVVSTTTALHSTRAGFEVGTRTAVDVVTAEKLLSQSKRDYARAKYDYVLEILRLKKATGTLAPSDLVFASDWVTK
jgi:outer membrane protein